MTSEVMAFERRGGMNSAKEVNMHRLVLLLVGLGIFGAYTATVVAGHGYTGFLELALSDSWGAQMFVDLVIALGLFAVWMVQDARREGLPSWPYLLATLLLGSIGALAYLLHRELRRLRAAREVMQRSAL